MNKVSLIKKIHSSKGNHIEKSAALCWAKGLPNDKPKPSKYKRGDVFMHPIFAHPYVLLKKTEEGWVCGLLTSNGSFEDVLEKCRSRFFGESYFTKVLFVLTNTTGSFMGVYENDRHLKKVLKGLKESIII